MSHQHDEQAPTIILVHGFLDDQTVWDYVTKRLDNTLQVKAIDLPGAGTRIRDTGPFTLQNLSGAVVEAIDAATGPVVLVGHSMGAQLVELAAVARPAKVTGLVLLTPIPLAGVHLSGESAESFRSLGGNVEAQRQGRLAVTASLTPQALELLLTSGAKPAPAVVAQVFDAWNDGDPAGLENSAFGGPTLVLNGTEDPFVTDEVLGSGVLPRFENISSMSIERAGHIPHLEQPSDVARIVGTFVSTLTRVEA
ncbi:alpha/beta fold hydrolase [Paenarthrobacter sp. NyZ202]|uniref:alpha/beta fold hydrolase n=1 Tax=Paenarthrobacter sp. NyZ202 TaxID=3402689 RepID=UPI003CF4F88F